MIDTRLKLSILWISHFLLWTFGDAVRIVSGTITEFPSETLLMVFAAPLGMIQSLLIIFNVDADTPSSQQRMRRLNMIFAVLYALINVAHIADVFINDYGLWELELVAVYLLCNFMTFRTASQWKIEE